MEGSSSTNMEDLGSKALDSIDVRKKQVGFSQSIHNKSTSATVIRDTRNKYLVPDLRSPQTPMSEGSMNAPRTFSDLCPEVRDTPPDAVAHQLTPKPNFVQSNVYPIRSKPRSIKSPTPTHLYPTLSQINRTHLSSLNLFTMLKSIPRGGLYSYTAYHQQPIINLYASWFAKGKP